MKKIVSIIVLILIVVSMACVFTACSEKDSDKLIDSYTIAPSVVNVGDTHGTPTITALMTDGTEKTVKNNLKYNAEDIEGLKLKDGKYTEAGTYSVRVYIIEEKEELFIGTWDITVKAVK